MGKINQIIKHLGKIKYPWPDKILYSSSSLNDLIHDTAYYKVNSIGMQPHYFLNQGIVWNNSSISPYGDSHIIRTYDAIYFIIRFAITTVINNTGNWNICKFTKDIIPQEYFFRDSENASDVLATIGMGDAGGAIFGVRGETSIDHSNDTTYQLIGQGYVINTKATTGLPVYNDYFISGKFCPNYSHLVNNIYQVPQSAIGIFNCVRTKAYAVYDPANTSLTFFRDFDGMYYNKQVIDTKTYFTDFENEHYTRFDQVPWASFVNNITSVAFNDSIKPLSLAYWFYNCSNLTTIQGIQALNTRKVADSSHMFENCSSLTQADLSFFDTLHLKNINSMLKGCSNLETLYTNNELDLTEVTDSNNLFYGCTSIVGQNGTVYNSSFIDKTYARLDIEENPGYLTYIGSKFNEDEDQEES